MRKSGADKDSDDGPESLLTRTALSVSLSAPRTPPVGTAHRSMLLGREPANYWSTTDDDEAQSSTGHITLRRRFMERLRLSHMEAPTRRPHPHLPAGLEVSDQITRFLGVLLSLEWQNQLRDSGAFRSVSDTFVTLSAPLVALTAPNAVIKFGALSMAVKHILYGPHPRQTLDFYLPQTKGLIPSRLIFFVHGGAWGR